MPNSIQGRNTLYIRAANGNARNDVHTGLIELYADRFTYVNRTGGPFGARRGVKV
jgi:hypothetical protein